jgi:hypothetical protein
MKLHFMYHVLYGLVRIVDEVEEQYEDGTGDFYLIVETEKGGILPADREDLLPTLAKFGRAG